MNIIISGGSRGIGRETALYLSKEKDNQILVTGRDEKALKLLANECENQNVSYFLQDITLIEEDADIVKNHISNRFSKVDILLNCAGSLIAKDFLEIRGSEAREMMETNFLGPAALMRLIIPIMPAGSHIVNLSSMGGFQGSLKFKGLSYYSASKAALACLTECLAVELADSGISVNCLALGSVRTEMFESAFPGYKAPVEPQDIAKFIAFFAIEGNKFINGKVIPVALRDP
jgi:NAD(P)-dependent dehydrogenase (short-subunit alcohol dehydrogenase family)